MIFKKIKFELYRWKKWIKSVFEYPKLKIHDQSYDEYWDHRHLNAATPLNSFQERRLRLVTRYVQENAVVTDIGAGNGLMLSHLSKKKNLSRCIAVDISDRALQSAKENGLDIFKANISSVKELEQIPETDYIFFFEVLEHIPNSEEILMWAISKARKGVLFSVPNTGFFTHRLRLVMGKFPLQWRLNPSEHLRFWTAKDMKWWLRQLGIAQYRLHMYEGPWGLRRVWPTLFSQGLFVFIPRSKK
jgi:2-polyprenyl-3-methyl-5-hydroxy-6-metoxy-1,4-benzoquinol methylase